MPACTMIRRLMTRALRTTKTRPIRNARGSLGQPIEALEDRTVPAYLFVDFGDNFPAGTLTTTTGALRDVANDAVAGNRILGPELIDSTMATTPVFNGRSLSTSSASRLAPRPARKCWPMSRGPTRG